MRGFRKVGIFREGPGRKLAQFPTWGLKWSQQSPSTPKVSPIQHPRLQPWPPQLLNLHQMSEICGTHDSKAQPSEVTTPRGGPHGQKLMCSCTHSPTTHLRDGWSAWGPSLECGRLAPLLGSPPRETQLCPQSCLSGATLPRKQALPLCSILKKKLFSW